VDLLGKLDFYDVLAFYENLSDESRDNFLLRIPDLGVKNSTSVGTDLLSSSYTTSETGPCACSLNLSVGISPS